MGTPFRWPLSPGPLVPFSWSLFLDHESHCLPENRLPKAVHGLHDWWLLSVDHCRINLLLIHSAVSSAPYTPLSWPFTLYYGRLPLADHCRHGELQYYSALWVLCAIANSSSFPNNRGLHSADHAPFLTHDLIFAGHCLIEPDIAGARTLLARNTG